MTGDSIQHQVSFTRNVSCAAILKNLIIFFYLNSIQDKADVVFHSSILMWNLFPVSLLYVVFSSFKFYIKLENFFMPGISFYTPVRIPSKCLSLCNQSPPLLLYSQCNVSERKKSPAVFIHAYFLKDPESFTRTFPSYFKWAYSLNPAGTLSVHKILWTCFI